MKKIRSYCGSFMSSSPPKGWAAVYSHLQFFIHNSFPDLVSRTWQIHRVSPLWQLDTSTSKLRSYSQLLNAHLAAVCPILTTALTNDFLTCNTGIANFSPAGGRWWCSSRSGWRDGTSSYCQSADTAKVWTGWYARCTFIHMQYHMSHHIS